MSADYQMQPADQAVREEALDPTRSFIVEAPAGSGKTELLTRRYLRLLAQVNAPEEIAAITFTRKAAAEMHDRVCTALAKVDDPKSPSHGSAAHALAVAVRSKDEELGWQLLAHPARLRIMTIDALNTSLARQLPILSGTGAVLPIARDTKLLYAAAIARVTEHLGIRDEHAEAIARLFRHLDNREDLLESLLAKELERREYWLDLGLLRFDTEVLRERLESSLIEVVAGELRELREQIPGEIHSELTVLAAYGAAMLNSLGLESPLTRCDALLDLPPAEAEALPYWQGIAELLLTDKGVWRKKVDRNLGFPPEPAAMKQRLTTLLDRLRTNSELAAALHLARRLPRCKYTDSQWQILTDLLDVLKLAIAELEVAMRDRGETDYVSNAIAARRALGTMTEPTDLALRLDYRLKHLLVDEFQDTARGQVKLLELLTAGWSEGDGRTLFCVGDPMQSIYRFRNADVGFFLNIKRRGLSQLRLTPLRLSVNFRSCKPVIEWVNRVFTHVLPLHDDPARGAVAYTASEPQIGAAAAGGVIVHALDGEKAEARAEEARQICALIASELQSSDTQIGVLVSNRLHVASLVRELRMRAIPFQAVDIDRLASRPAIQDLTALTRALVHLADRVAWLSVLRAPWCGLSLADLYSLCDAEVSTTLWQLLDTDRIARVSTDGQQAIARIRPILETALAVRGRCSLRDCVERAWHALGGPATVFDASALNDCAAYFERLEQLERKGDLEDSARLEQQLADLFAHGGVSPQSSRVKLMTIHSAKGLEFDMVILPALDSGAKIGEGPALRVQELPDLGEHSLLLAPIAARGEIDENSTYQWLGHLDKERSRLEQARLLYVAATRAKRELHLFGAIQEDEKGMRGPKANTFLHLLWPAVEPVFAARARTLAPTDTVIRQRTEGILTKRLPLAWRPPPPIEAIGTTTFRDVIENEPLHPEFEWVGETARHVGTLVHREIERIARTSAGDDAASIAADAIRYHVELAELGVPPHLRDNAVARVVSALTRMLGDERGRWTLAGANVHREATSEFPLSGVIDGNLVNCIIDRMFVAQDGTRWIVDFKTSAHEGGGLQEFLDNEAERYRGQLQRYARLMSAYRPGAPIKAALYFPLLRAWREVALN